MVVDDTVTYRKTIAEALSSIDGVEVVGLAVNGRFALEKIGQLKPELVTLDVEMPELNGIETLEQLRARHPEVGVVMVAGETSAAARLTTTALALGAFDFILKPSGGNPDDNRRRLRDALTAKVAAFVAKQTSRLAGGQTPDIAPRQTDDRLAGKAHQLVLIGISTGGPEALGRFLPKLPADLPAPILIVQHMPPLFTASLAEDLNRRSALRVVEARDEQPIDPGVVYIAPGGRNMKLVGVDGGYRLRITDDPPENSCRPSVDYLFRSVSQLPIASATLALIMTGMGNDGALGCRLLKRRGATIAAQDRDSCVVFGMPMYPIQEGLADVVAPLSELDRHIVAGVVHKEPACR